MPKKLDSLAVDALDGGLDPAVEYPAETPPEPGYAENDGLWIWDDTQSVGIHTWLRHSGTEDELPFERITVFLPNGSLLVDSAFGAPGSKDMGLAVGVVEPFRTWFHRYEGELRPTSAAELRDGRIPADRERVPVTIDATAHMVVPPWIQGGFYASTEEWRATPAGSFHGGFRFEQLLEGTATMTVGTDTYTFSGPGLRTHRKGRRVLGTKAGLVNALPGHIWLDAHFPSGRAFYVKFFSGADGREFEGGECWVRQDGVFHRAELRNPPFFTPSLPGEQNLSFDLVSALGTTHIEGTVVVDSFQTMGATMPDWWGIDWDTTAEGALAMNQGFVRYRWDDEVAVNMVERSLPIRDLQRPTGDPSTAHR